MPTVRFVNMWQGFDPSSNPLLPILRLAAGTEWRVVVDRATRVDLEVGSVYPSRWAIGRRLAASLVSNGPMRMPSDVREHFQPPPKSDSARRGLWYTPENRRPPSEGWDGFLTYESEGWPSNAYLPFWQLNSDIYGGEFAGFLGETIRARQLSMPRQVNTGERAGFCCAVFRNPDPVRLAAIKELAELGPVDVFGPVSGRPVATKREIFRQYRFALVFENDLYPGYVTEKLFDAWQSECVPLYWGLAPKTLNDSAFVNMAHLGGPRGLANAVSRLLEDSESINSVAGAPLLRTAPSPEPVVDLVRTVLDG